MSDENQRLKVCEPGRAALRAASEGSNADHVPFLRADGGGHRRRRCQEEQEWRLGRHEWPPVGACEHSADPSALLCHSIAE